VGLLRDMTLWPRCTRCEHRVNPRNEICPDHHLMCSPTGCIIEPGSWPNVRGPVAEAPAVVPFERRASATTFLVDLASYQAGINLAAVKAAGFTRVNVKLTQGNWYTMSSAAGWIRQARDLGMGVSTFTWIDNSASGAEQAAYMWRAMLAAGGPAGIAHQVDCEDSARPATLQILTDYINAVKSRMGRTPILYSGDWWLQPRGWNCSGLTPYLWAGPNNGYLSSYPGDTSGAWRAGYAGYGDYAMLQYAVQPVDGAGGGNLSKTAIRDPAVWAALTGTGGNDVGTLDGQQAVMLANIWRVIEGWRAGSETVKQDTGSGIVDFPLMPVRSANALLEAAGQVNQILTAVTEPDEISLDAEQIAGLISSVTAAIVAAPDNPITDADAQAVANAVGPVVEAKLREIARRASG
jgi:hypothetical protein